MSYSDTEQLEISEIIDNFSPAEIRAIVERQILYPKYDMLGDMAVNQFDVMYSYYINIMENNEDPDLRAELQERFLDICDIYLNAIDSKYAIGATDEWLNDHQPEVPHLTSILYSMFVVHNMMNLEDMLFKYIMMNRKSIFETFEDSKMKKDASTISKKRNFTIEDSVILSGIYDICAWILDNLSVEEFFKYSDMDNVDISEISQMYENLQLGGSSSGDLGTEIDFVDRFSAIYKSDIAYKGILCNNLISRLIKAFQETGPIPDPKKEIMSITGIPDESQESDD